MHGSELLVRFINVLGATIVGALATGGVIFFVARGLGLGGGGIFYTFIFIVATAASYRWIHRLTSMHPFVKVLVGLLGVALVTVFVANWRALGAEDPGIPLVIAVLFLGIGFWVSGMHKEKRANKP